MNLELVDRIVNAVLYEGYVLYPYRRSSAKNQRRFNFGVLVPPQYSEACSSRTECLFLGGPETRLDIKVRFLQVTGTGSSWQEATEREISLQSGLNSGQLHFQFPPIIGAVTATVQHLEDRLYRIAVEISNRTPMEGPAPEVRDDILPLSLVSTHTILAAQHGEFVSLLDPPEEFCDAASQCHNIGTWPVLAGDPAERDMMLSSPIILYDYPQVAPESPGDLFDGAEIDEILTLRILAMTDDEKEEMRQTDERTRRILERTEMLPEEQLMKLHGALRQLRPVSQEPQ